VSAKHYCVPDVVVLDRALPEEEIVTIPPLAVFEILSREDRMTRIMFKLKDYESMSIPLIRVIDPKTSTIWSYAGGVLTALKPDTDETTGRLQLNWPAIWKLREDL
jgi:Uma2 family endonuclease